MDFSPATLEYMEKYFQAFQRKEDQEFFTSLDIIPMEGQENKFYMISKYTTFIYFLRNREAKGKLIQGK